jgi:hypothetical protein
VAICRPSAGGNTQAARAGVSRTRRVDLLLCGSADEQARVDASAYGHRGRPPQRRSQPHGEEHLARMKSKPPTLTVSQGLHARPLTSDASLCLLLRRVVQSERRWVLETRSSLMSPSRRALGRGAAVVDTPSATGAGVNEMASTAAVENEATKVRVSRSHDGVALPRACFTPSKCPHVHTRCSVSGPFLPRLLGRRLSHLLTLQPNTPHQLASLNGRKALPSLLNKCNVASYQLMSTELCQANPPGTIDHVSMVSNCTRLTQGTLPRCRHLARFRAQPALIRVRPVRETWHRRRPLTLLAPALHHPLSQRQRNRVH